MIMRTLSHQWELQQKFWKSDRSTWILDHINRFLKHASFDQKIHKDYNCLLQLDYTVPILVVRMQSHHLTRIERTKFGDHCLNSCFSDCRILELSLGILDLYTKRDPTRILDFILFIKRVLRIHAMILVVWTFCWLLRNLMWNP